MAAKKTPKNKPATRGKHPGGRPPKDAHGAADHIIGLRLTPPDKALLDAIVGQEQDKLRAAGMMTAVAGLVRPADVLRSMIREEAQRRGLAIEARV